MKIGIVCPYSMSVPGGVQNQVLGLADHLAGAGEQVSVLAPGELDPGQFRTHRSGRVSFTSSGPALPIRYNGSVARVNFGPGTAHRVRRWLAEENPDLLHLHEPVTPSASLLTLVRARVPVAATFHTATPRSYSMGMAGSLFRRTIDRIDLRIAVSESARSVVNRYLGRDALVLPNGFDRGEFRTADEPATSGRPSAGRPPRLAFLGRLNEPRKGLDVLLAALPSIRRQVGDLDLVIAGEGRRRLPPGCRATGRISDPERARLLASSDLFIAPHVARESFGIVLLEAMAAGATVVASDLPPFTDLLTGPDGPLGYEFAAGDPDALARTVVRALAEDRTAMTERARTASDRYDWSVVGAEIGELYRGLLAGTGGQPGRSESVASARR